MTAETARKMPSTWDHSAKIDRWLVWLLRMGTCLCFAGWTWVHYYWEAPYGVLLWHDATYQIATRLGLSWDQFVGSGANDGFIQSWMSRTVWLFLACTILSLTVRRGAWLQMAGLMLGSLLLTTISYAKYLSSQQQLPMFIEHGGQMLMPLLLIAGLAGGVKGLITQAIAIAAVVMTFGGHGCYAIGWWPTPANFYAMTSIILGIDFEAARIFLRAAGILDIVVCVAIFVPWTRRYAAFYAAVWGLLTAVARPAAGMSFDLHYWGADQFFHEAILRTPHWIIPLYLFCLWSASLRPTPSLEQPVATQAMLQSSSISLSPSP